MSATATLVLLAGSLVAGAGAGVTGRALTRPAGPAAAAAAPGPARSTHTAAAHFLGAGDLLTPEDFTSVGWHDTAQDGGGDGEPQFAYSCQRRQLAATGYPTGVISATWVSRTTLTAAETVAQLENLPQTGSLFAQLVGWYDDCSAGSTTRTPSSLVGTVRAARSEARVWRVGRSGDPRPTYAIVARADARIALVDVYTDHRAPDPAGLRDLARRVLERLG